MKASSPSYRQRGSTLIEFSLAAILLLTLGLGIVETAHWFAVRQAVGLALMQAARTGAVTHARPEAIEREFERGLSPLLAGAASAVLSTPSWRIQINSPYALAFNDFDRLPAALAPAPFPALDNDYLAEQHARYLARGWPQGRGPQSGQTIFEANTLTLTLYYPHRPLLASTRAALRLLASAVDSGAGPGNVNIVWRQGFVVLHRRVSTVMQSHPVLWPDAPSGRVIRSVPAQ